MPEREVDLFVIGGGSGGVRAARIAAGYGATVMLAEEFRLGGTCVIRGCVPKKLLVYASRYPGEIEDAAGFGWSVSPPLLDWQSLIAAKEAEITRLERAYLRTQESAGVTVVRTRAVIEDAHTVRLKETGERIRAKTIVIATGGHPNMPELPGVEFGVNSNEIFDLPVFPKRIVIAGGGYIAVEFASIFLGLGSEVTLIYRGTNILRGFDEDMRAGLRDAFIRRGMKVLLDDTFSRIEKTSDGLVMHTRSGQRLDADQVLFAIGRSPNVHELGLDAAGIEQDDEGAIVVDEHSRTSVSNIYAVGDVTNRVNLTPVAIREGHAVADNLFGGKNIRIDYSNIPTAVFSTPEIGTVGLTEHQARERHRIVDVYRTNFRPMKSMLTGRQDRCLMKLLVDGETDKVLGCHILGDGAGEMAQILGIVVKMGATKADFDITVALHPSSAEELVTMHTRSERFERP